MLGAYGRKPENEKRPRRGGRVPGAFAPCLAFTLSLAALALIPASASAASDRPLSSSFGIPAPGLLAVNQTTGNVYVPEEGGGVKIFKANGEEASPHELSGDSGAYGVATDESNDSTKGDIYVANPFSSPRAVKQFKPNGEFTGLEITAESIPGTAVGGGPGGSFEPTGPAVDSHGNIFVPDYPNNVVDEFNSSGTFVKQFGAEGELAGKFDNPNQLAVDDSGGPSNGDVYVVNNNGGKGLIEFDPTGSCVNACASIDANSTLSVTVDQANGDVYAQDGQTPAEIIVYPPSGGTPIEHFGSGDIGYGFGVAVNSRGEGGVSAGAAYVTDRNQSDVHIFEYPSAPMVTESVTGVQSDIAILHAQINPGGGDTTYHFEYVDGKTFQEDLTASGNGFEHATKTPIPDVDIGTGLTYQSASAQLSGLTPGTTYHWRVVATNVTETTNGPERTFATYPFLPFNDRCPNAHVRQQSGSALLPDCRAYELVSAANSGGYDVESDLTAGQSPYAGYPEAENPSRVLYAVHGGAIPASGEPTNRGPDPYIATRGKEGWSTTYVGVPADNPFSAAPFTSIPSGADASLETFAYASPGGCSPCFEAAYTGIPVHRPNGELIQGMVGPENPGPSATQGGFIAKDLSANGEHLIFGSASQFAPGGNSGGAVPSIYDHNLISGETHAVSDTPAGAPLPCLQSAGEGECHAPNDSNGIAELDISKDGSHILLAQKVSEDADHNVYWHLYMDVGDSSQTIDLTPGVIASPGGPGFAEGVLFDGMSADGSKVFFTTKDPLTTATNQDTDTSADVYEAEVSGSSATVTRISTGEALTGNTDLCEPVANSDGPHWNTVGLTKDCSAVAIGGGGGVAATDGSIYFLSPELLDGASNGTANQPNFYLAAPGSAPRFIATLEPNNPAVLDAVKATGTRHTADFQVAPSGEFVAFTSTLPLSGFESAGHAEVFRYDAVSETLACASCDPTGVEPSNDSALAPNGLSLTDNGRLFFTTAEPLVERDGDNRKDVYEWEAQGIGAEAAVCQTAGGCVDLVSTGSSPFDATLLGASANGTDAYFFTRDKLVPQDENGSTVKIYDARELGGFEYTPPPVPCKASDECHGPSSPTPPPPSISLNTGTAGNEVTSKCKKGLLEKHGKCVKKTQHKHKHHKRASQRRGGKK